MKWYLLILVLIIVGVAVSANDYNFYLTKSIADDRYLDTTCHLYIANSMKKTVVWNISESESAEYNFDCIAGEYTVPIGGEII